MNIQPAFGHNNGPLYLLAADALRVAALAKGSEDEALEYWVTFGGILNEARDMLPSDEQFGQWLVNSNLEVTHPAERSAAMWAAGFPEQFEEARAAGNARTVRGIHAKWKENEAERKAKEAREDAERARAEAEAKAKAAEDARKKAQAEKDEAGRAKAKEVAAKADAENKAAQKAAEQAEKDAKKAEKKAGAGKTTHVAQNTGNNEWYTPEKFIEAARKVLQGFDLDPASSALANETVKASKIFTEEDDGLEQDWPTGRIWMNPPYATPLIGRFADKFADEIKRGSTGIVLVNNATETGWFQVLASVATAICFPKSRIRFVDPDGKPSGAPLQGQAFLYCGPDVDAFSRKFRDFGMVVYCGGGI